MLELLPLKQELETKEIMKLVAQARGAIAELKGVACSMPNPQILVNTLTLQEAKDSSQIENIITTNDELFSSNYQDNIYTNLASKEVYKYNNALNFGFETMVANNRENPLITENLIKIIQSKIISSKNDYRQIINCC